MYKVAFINQRYGLEVNGGSEYYTRVVAEHLAGCFDVEILTTKAIDYVTWDNYYPADEEEINGVKVRRFPVTRSRDMRSFGTLTGNILAKRNRKLADEQEWVDAQGPYSPDLVQYINSHADEYDLFVFVTYLYYSTCVGMRGVYEKSVLIPTAHDEPYIYFSIYRDVFTKVKGIVFLTDEEKAFVQQLFRNQRIPSIVTAVGIDRPAELEVSETKAGQAEEPENVRKKVLVGAAGELEDPYIIYVGRIDESKGCKELFDYFLRYKQQHSDSIKLVLLGKEVLTVPRHPDILYKGFVSETDKFKWIQNAAVMILPSQFESLSLSVLEALQMKTPVIVNGKCSVLRGHCVKSNAGLYYENYYEFEQCLLYLFEHEATRQAMGRNGERYVDTYYRWDKVRDDLVNFFTRMISGGQS